MSELYVPFGDEDFDPNYDAKSIEESEEPSCTEEVEHA